MEIDNEANQLKFDQHDGADDEILRAVCYGYAAKSIIGCSVAVADNEFWMRIDEAEGFRSDTRVIFPVSVQEAGLLVSALDTALKYQEGTRPDHYVYGRNGRVESLAKLGIAAAPIQAVRDKIASFLAARQVTA